MRFITIHAAATHPDMDIGVEEIRQWHLDRGFRDIGYHYVIRRDGTIETGRPADQTGAHVGGFNTGNLGVCMVGGVDKYTNAPQDNFTVDQWESLHRIMTRLHEKHPEAIIMGHNGFPGHESRGCPCFDWRLWRRQFLWSLREAEVQLPSHWYDEVDTGA